MVIVPMFQVRSADFLQRIELGGSLVIIRMVWNIRSGFFFLSFTDGVGNELTGLKMVPQWPLLTPHRGSIEFTGDLLLVKTDAGAPLIPSYESLGAGWDLVYLTPAEIDLWRTLHGMG